MSTRKRSTTSTVTILDVAKHADVSPMTASRVINKHPYVGLELRDRVNAAVKSLGYHPNLAGRSLRSASTLRIGVLYSNPSAAYLNQLMLGVLEQGSLAGVQVLVEKCSGLRSQQTATQRLLDAGADGVILPPPLCDSRSTIDKLRARNVAVVAVATAAPRAGVASVRIDDYQGARAMTRHLLELGHRRIGLITGDPQHTPTALRTAGFLDTLAEAGIHIADHHIAQGLFTYRSGLAASQQLLQLRKRPTALFCSNDDMAAAAIAVAHGMGLRVPEQLSISGFDDTSLATTVWPELTTIRQPVTAMGQAAVSILIEAIRHRRNSDDAPHQLLKYTLVKRQSTAPAAPG
jgi:LacI family transcriptional regulator